MFMFGRALSYLGNFGEFRAERAQMKVGRINVSTLNVLYNGDGDFFLQIQPTFVFVSRESLPCVHLRPSSSNHSFTSLLMWNFASIYTSLATVVSMPFDKLVLATLNAWKAFYKSA